MIDLRKMRRRHSWGLIVTTALVAVSLVHRVSAEIRSQQGDPVRAALVELRSYVERFTGPEPADCGQHALVRPFEMAGVEQLQKSASCARDAATNRKPFWTFKQEQGIDSQVYQGLLGTADGTIFRFSYDSAPCGGPGCGGRFSIERCRQPGVVTSSGSRAEFRCRLSE